MSFDIKISFGNDSEKMQDYSSERIALLNILQGIISRLANSKTALKVAGVTVLSALLAFSAVDGSIFEWYWFIPVSGIFMYFHAYFLQQERAFVKLYNIEAAKNKNSPVDFVIDTEKLRLATESIFSVLMRKTVFGFHLSLCVGFMVISYLSRNKGAVDLCLRMYV